MKHVFAMGWVAVWTATVWAQEGQDVAAAGYAQAPPTDTGAAAADTALPPTDTAPDTESQSSEGAPVAAPTSAATDAANPTDTAVPVSHANTDVAPQPPDSPDTIAPPPTARTAAAEPAGAPEQPTPEPAGDDLLHLTLEDLLAQEVTTASKRSESVRTSPSNITIITDTQIREWGLLDLQDVLRRVAGYLVLYDRDEWAYSARGNVADNNQKYLILVDGHRMNSTENFGPGQINEPPMTLRNIKRIEIIRGPGSAVWGSEALAGVINLITYTGADLGDTPYRAEVFYGNGLPDFDSHTVKADFQVGTAVSDELDFSLFGSFVTSKGRVIRTDASNGLSAPYWYRTYCGADPCTADDPPEAANTKPPYGRYQTDLGRYKPSYLLQGRAHVGDFAINALFFHTQVKNRHFEANDLTETPDGTALDRKTWYTTDKVFVEGTWSRTLDNGLELTWKTSGDRNDSQFVPTEDPALFISWKDTRFLTSLDSFLPLFDGRADLSAGLDYGYTQYGPSVRFDTLDPTQTASQVDNPDRDADKDGLITKLTDDNNLGGYLLGGIHLFDKRFHVSGGTRIDFNGDRGNEALALAPRAAIIYEFPKYSVLKLVWNTGFLRPANFQRSDLTVNPERMRQAEIIGMVNLDPLLPLSFTVTAYWQQLRGIILIAGGGSSGYLGNGFTNTGDYTSIGAELEALVQVGGHDIWGNLSLARPRGGNYVDGLDVDYMRIKPDEPGAQEGRLLNYPTVMFNLGSTLRFFHRVTFAPALRFQGPMTYRAAPAMNSLDDAVYRTSDPMVFLDAAVTVYPTKELTVHLVGKNLLNERGPEPISVWNGTRQLYGTYVEAGMGVQF